MMGTRTPLKGANAVTRGREDLSRGEANLYKPWGQMKRTSIWIQPPPLRRRQMPQRTAVAPAAAVVGVAVAGVAAKGCRLWPRPNNGEGEVWH
jgi:hypothetical protein